jgi:hypothetical protein
MRKGVLVGLVLMTLCLPVLSAGEWDEWERLTKIIMPKQGSPEGLEAARQLLQTWPPSPDNGQGSQNFRQQIYYTYAHASHGPWPGRYTTTIQPGSGGD